MSQVNAWNTAFHHPLLNVGLAQQVLPAARAGTASAASASPTTTTTTTPVQVSVSATSSHPVISQLLTTLSSLAAQILPILLDSLLASTTTATALTAPPDAATEPAAK